MPALHKRSHPHCNQPYSTSPSVQRFGTNDSPQYLRSLYAVPRTMSGPNDFHQSQGSAPTNSSSSEDIYDPTYFNFTNTLPTSFPHSSGHQLPSQSMRNFGPDIHIDTSEVDHSSDQTHYLSQGFPLTTIPHWSPIPSTPPAISTPSYTLAFEADPAPYQFTGYPSNQFSGTPNRHISPSGSAEILLPPGYPVSAHPTACLTPPTTPASRSHSHMSSSPGTDVDLPAFQQTIGSTLDNKNKKLYTHREQLQFFRNALSLPLSGNPGPFIQQQMYKPHTNSDRRRYVEEVELEEPIYFWTENPEECGIPLSDALHSRVKRLVNRDETVFEGRGPSVSIRLEWPGYRQWSRQIPTKDFRSPPGPITRAKLAKNVAKCVQRFILERQNQSLEDDADARWRVGPEQNQIKLDDLVLVSIHHVSMGSWQPHLRLKRPFH